MLRPAGALAVTLMLVTAGAKLRHVVAESAGLGQVTDNLKGEWVGAFRLGEELVSFRVAFKTEQQGVTVTLIRMLRDFPGTVTAVHVAKKDRVEHGAVLVEIEQSPL